MSCFTPPASPRDEVAGMVYFVRLCDKIRMFADGALDSDFHANLGKGMDLWTCQFLHVEYDELKNLVNSGASDQEALEWCWKTGVHPSELELSWWNSYMRNRGFRDDLSDKLKFRKEESKWHDREQIKTFFDYLDADDGRL